MSTLLDAQLMFAGTDEKRRIDAFIANSLDDLSVVRAASRRGLAF